MLWQSLFIYSGHSWYMPFKLQEFIIMWFGLMIKPKTKVFVSVNFLFWSLNISLSQSLPSSTEFEALNSWTVSSVGKNSWLEAVQSLKIPDEPFHNFRASRSGDRRILFSGATDFEAPKLGKSSSGKAFSDQPHTQHGCKQFTTQLHINSLFLPGKNIESKTNLQGWIRKTYQPELWLNNSPYTWTKYLDFICSNFGSVWSNSVGIRSKKACCICSCVQGLIGRKIFWIKKEKKENETLAKLFLTALYTWTNKAPSTKFYICTKWIC